jgi:hypothetical protein
MSQESYDKGILHMKQQSSGDKCDEEEENKITGLLSIIKSKSSQSVHLHDLTINIRILLCDMA